MKYINHYFPFFILTLLLYGWFFHFHKQTTIIPDQPINSGQQAIQLQFVELASTIPEDVPADIPEEKPITKEEPLITKEQTQPTAQPKENSSPEKNAPKQQTAETITETVSEPVPPTPVVNEQPISAPSKRISDVKIAKQALQQTIRETSAVSDAILKAEIFTAELNLSPSALETETTINRSHQQIQPKPTPVNKIKKIVKQSEPAPKPTPAPQPVQNKPVFKKQPATNRSQAQTQGVLQEAIVVSGNTPVYPQRAILRNQQGRVVVKLTVTTKGKAKNAQIITSSGYPILDNAILDFVQQELFMPAHRGEDKIISEQIFAFRFELK